MIDERTEEDAALYALGSLSTEEAAVFEERLRSDAELHALVRSLEETASSLVHAAPLEQPRPQVRDAILASIRGEKIAASAPHRSTNWFPWALAAVLTAVAGLLALERGRLQHEIIALRDRDEFSRLRISSLVAQVENASKTVGAVAWDNEKQRGILTIEKLPPLDPTQDYQLWVIDPNLKQPVSGGIVRVDDTGAARLVFTVDVPIRDADKFAVSRERKGGAPAPEGQILMVGQ